MTAWYLKSLSDLERDAAGGDPRALLLLAQAHLRGLRGAAVDPARAQTLLERAAGRGSGIAARWLGDEYNDRDDAKNAMTWWRRAAELGDTGAMTNLLDGSGSAEESRWMVLAAEAGEPYAREALRKRLAGEPAQLASLAQLARTPLEQLAAEADDEDGLDVDLVVRRAEAVNDLVGRSIERIFALWPSATASAKKSGAPFDFPGPLPPPEEDEEINVHVGAGIYDVVCDVNFSERKETWDVTWMSVAPHPPSAEIERLESVLREEAKALTSE
jgi:hypothetical protein